MIAALLCTSPSRRVECGAVEVRCGAMGRIYSSLIRSASRPPRFATGVSKHLAVSLSGKFMPHPSASIITTAVRYET